MRRTRASGPVLLKADRTGPRFVVYFMANGAFCAPLYVCRNGAVTEKDGEEIHPYRIENGVVCHHCTSKRNFTRARAMQNKIRGLKPRRTVGRRAA